MIKQRKRREQWAPEREPDALFPEPPSDDPFLEFARDNPIFGDRIWLYPELEAEPSLDRWLDAILAIDDERRKDQTKLAALLKSDHPLQQHARGHLANFIDRYQERDALAQLLDKLQSGARIEPQCSVDTRLALRWMPEPALAAIDRAATTSALEAEIAPNRDANYAPRTFSTKASCP